VRPFKSAVVGSISERAFHQPAGIDRSDTGPDNGQEIVA